MEDTFLESTWRNIEPSLNIILGDDKNSSLDSLMYTDTYTKVYNYCTASSKRSHINVSHYNNSTVRLVGSDLYEKIKEFLKVYLEKANKKDNESFIQYYIRAWKRYLIGSKRLNDVMDYLNRYWVTKERSSGHRDVYDIFSLCLLSWRDYKFYPNLTVLMDEIMEQIEANRQGISTSVNDLNTAIKSFVLLGFDANDLKKQNLSVYINDFEKRFLTDTHNFYTLESKNYINENGAVNYISKALQRIDEELKNLEDLNDHTRKPLNDVLNKVLIQDHQEKIRNELPNLLDQERYDDIKKINILLKRVPLTLPPLLEIFEKYIENQGLDEIVQFKLQCDEEFRNLNETYLKSISESSANPKTKLKLKKPVNSIDPNKYIKTLIKIYKKYKVVVENSFDNSPTFIKSLENACRKFINSNAIATPTPKSKSKTPDLLAKYCDEFLRGKSDDLNIEEIITIFKFVEDKEGFEIWYRRYLSKRLLLNNLTPEEEENEELIIQKLKAANSVEYTNKITNMFNDIRLSKNLGLAYKDLINRDFSNSKDMIINELDPRILDNASWSQILKNNNESFNLPTELVLTEELFTSLYKERHNGRQLNWIWNRSKIEIKANLSKPGKPPYLFTVSLFQYAILSNFQDKDMLTTSELIETTGLPLDVFKSNMVPFIKQKLITQNPPGEKNLTNPQTTFTIVKEYTSKKLKINFSQVKQSESTNEEKETNEEIERRKHELLKAGIVRIMKARKSIKHEQLVTEVFTIIQRFKPTVGEIKKAIEVLLDEQYLARNEEGTGYEYIS
jgi:cullin 1